MFRMKLVVPLMLAAVAFGSACTPTTDAAAPDAPGATLVTQSDAPTLLVERGDAYAEVFEQARAQGFIAGALRGLLLGALVDGERGAVVGAALGAALGGAYAETAATQLLREREEFLNRQQIIENILAASQGATRRSTDDARIVSRAVTHFTTLAEPVDPALSAEVGASIAAVRQAVELRAVILAELMHANDLPPEEAAAVQAEIDLQRAALTDIRAQQDAWSARNDG